MTQLSIESGIQKDPLGREIRKEESSVLTSGTAVLVFAIWTALKICAGILLNQKELNAMLENADVPKAQLLIGFILAVIAFIVISTSAHIYIGLSARALAMDRRIKPPYLIVSWLAFALTVISLTAVLLDYIVGEAETGELVSIIIDLTLVIALWRLNRSTVRLNKLRRQNTGE